MDALEYLKRLGGKWECNYERIMKISLPFNEEAYAILKTGDFLIFIDGSTIGQEKKHIVALADGYVVELYLP